MRIAKSGLPKKRKIRKNVVCLSASVYKDAISIEGDLKKLGFAVLLPYTAHIMKKTGNFDVAFYKTWLRDPKTYKNKAFKMRHHLRKVISGDAVLVANLEKDGIPGYIGGNTLIEMAFAFYHKKPIYVLHDVFPNSPYYEEILGMAPVFIDGDLTKIK